MIDILLDDLLKMIDENTEIKYFSATETSYDYFKVECDINEKSYRILETRNSRCSDMVFTDTSHDECTVNYIVKKIKEIVGDVEFNLYYTYNHNPACWEEDYGDFDGYYDDGLDHIEELYYME